MPPVGVFWYYCPICVAESEVKTLKIIESHEFPITEDSHVDLATYDQSRESESFIFLFDSNDMTYWRSKPMPMEHGKATDYAYQLAEKVRIDTLYKKQLRQADMEQNLLTCLDGARNWLLADRELIETESDKEKIIKICYQHWIKSDAMIGSLGWLGSDSLNPAGKIVRNQVSLDFDAFYNWYSHALRLYWVNTKDADYKEEARLLLSEMVDYKQKNNDIWTGFEVTLKPVSLLDVLLKKING